jgi:predicted dehydrogenase
MSVKAVIIGCGDIARKSYAASLAKYPEIELLGFADLDKSRAEALTEEYGGKAYESPQAVFDDPEVTLVVNLTIHHAHYEVIKAALEAGKHVYTEKPFASTSKQARELVDLAASKNLGLYSAPIVYLGEAQQAAWDVLESGETGPIRLVFAEINHARIEIWHSNPQPFYDVGVMWDVGVYPLTVITALLGPVVEVSAVGKVLLPERKTQSGDSFTISTPDAYVLNLTLAGGALARVSANFYALKSRQGSSLELHGDNGSILMESSFLFHGSVTKVDAHKQETALDLGEDVTRGVEFGRGIQFMARRLESGDLADLNPEHALHVVEIMEAAAQSVTSGQAVNLQPRFQARRVRFEN